jgi:hypothetical protein
MLLGLLFTLATAPRLATGNTGETGDTAAATAAAAAAAADGPSKGLKNAAMLLDAPGGLKLKLEG